MFQIDLVLLNIIKKQHKNKRKNDPEVSLTLPLFIFQNMQFAVIKFPECNCFS
jgi:hypothetical protein